MKRKTRPSLSTRESQVLRLMGQGNSMAQLRVRLNLSESSVSKYHERLKRKLGASNFCELISLAVRYQRKRTAIIRNVSRGPSLRERQLLALLGEGKLTRDISTELEINLKTVHTL